MRSELFLALGATLTAAAPAGLARARAQTAVPLYCYLPMCENSFLCEPRTPCTIEELRKWRPSKTRPRRPPPRVALWTHPGSLTPPCPSGAQGRARPADPGLHAPVRSLRQMGHSTCRMPTFRKWGHCPPPPSQGAPAPPVRPPRSRTPAHASSR